MARFSCPTQHSSLHVIAHFPPRLFLTILKVNHLHLVTSGMGGCAVWGFICLAACLSGGPRTPSPTGQVVTVPSLSPCPLSPRSCSAGHATCEEAQDGLPRATLKEVCGQWGPRETGCEGCRHLPFREVHTRRVEDAPQTVRPPSSKCHRHVLSDNKVHCPGCVSWVDGRLLGDGMASWASRRARISWTAPNGAHPGEGSELPREDLRLGEFPPRSWHCQGLEPFQGRTLTIMSSSMLSASPASWLQW